ncbi:CAP-Gly domain-containing linker protein 1-like [Etheostoma cragini]|uniref:CAP-Gly domain-containing linker protein 1-like n=1 Tax=Etheostoma cragini TaxID=417921 RepID=UPI00155E50B5|nr:CAP-Gly domain-containing linker protein 1-like [Etheostoma cragini]
MNKFQEYAEEEIMKEFQDQHSVSSRDDYSYTFFSETEESERSERSEKLAGLLKALEKEKRANAALEEALKKAQTAKAKDKRALKQERKEKDALAKALRKEQAEKKRLCFEMEHMKAQVADFKKSQKEQQRSKAKLKSTITGMAAELEEDKNVIEKLQKDLEVSSCKQEKEIAERDRVNEALKTLKDRIIEQDDESLEKDNQIQSLHLNVQNLQSNIESKDNMVSSLQQKANQWASDLEEEKTKNCLFRRDYEATVSQQQKEAEELDHLTHENQQLASEKKRLQGELEAAVNERQIHQKDFQEAQEACSKLEKAIKKEKVRFSTAYNKLQIQERELSEKSLALEKSLTAEKFLKLFVKNEKKRYKQLVLSNQARVKPLAIPSNQLREASATSGRLMYDMQTLRMENADVTAKFNVMQTEYDRIRSKLCSLSERHEEMMLKNNDIISENNVTITKLQFMVDGFKEQLSDSKARQAELEEALKQDQKQNLELQQRMYQITSALEKERTRCEKHRVELKEALTKQIETMEEKHKLAVAHQKAHNSYVRLREQQLAESNYQYRHVSDTELRLNQQKTALDESAKALQHLQQEYILLGKRHGDNNSDYCELLKSHSALQIRYERLSYAQGNPRPDFSPPHFTIKI